MTTQVLVLGAGGNVGRPLVERLRAQGVEVRAASRSGRAVAGAPGVVFDYADPATHAAAFDGVAAAYVMLPGGHVNIQPLLMPVVQGLADRGTKIVFQSVFGVDADDSIPYRQVELAIERSGVPWVTLRPNWFADNFHTYWKAGLDHGVIAVPAGDGATSFIDARDIAAAAAAALTGPAHDGRAWNLTGPQALSYGEAAVLLSEVLGKPIAYQALDDAAFIALLEGAGVPGDYAQFLTAIFAPVRQGWTAAVTDDVRQLTGQAPRTLLQYARDHRAALAA